MANKVISKFGSQLKELRVHLCLAGKSSEGVREFIGKHYASVKQLNPNLPILVREAQGIEPKLWARFEYGRETSASLSGLNGDQVLQVVQSLTKDK